MRQSELIQIIQVHKRRLQLIRGYNATRAEYHDAGPWSMVASPRALNDDLGPDRVTDYWRFCLELPGFGPRVHWLAVQREILTVVQPGDILMALTRMGDPVGWA